MHSPLTLQSIYVEHDRSMARMAETLLDLRTPLEDVTLLSALPWPYLANRVAVERERLGMPAAHPLLPQRLPPRTRSAPMRCDGKAIRLGFGRRTRRGRRR